MLCLTDECGEDTNVESKTSQRSNKATTNHDPDKDQVQSIIDSSAVNQSIPCETSDVVKWIKTENNKGNVLIHYFISVINLV